MACRSSNLCLVDLTTEGAEESASRAEGSPPEVSLHDDASNLNDEERGLLGNEVIARSGGSSIDETAAEETDSQPRPSSVMTGSSAYVKKKTSQFLEAVRGNGSQKSITPISTRLASMVDAYASSDIAAEIRTEIISFTSRDPAGELPDVAEEDRLLRGRKGANWLTQFRILSGRAFKNLYRDPALLMAHYVSSIVLAGGSLFMIFFCSLPLTLRSQ